MICKTKSQATEKADIAIHKVLDCKIRSNDTIKISTFFDKTCAIVKITKTVDKDTTNSLSFHEYEQKTISKIISKLGMKCYTISSDVMEFRGKYTTSQSMHFTTDKTFFD
tara:strand:+ start:216 stop:545 length:330 start_codon:yes stop_codon:yes gene_type:complete